MTWLWSCPAGAVTWRVSRWPGADVSRSTGTSPPLLADQDLARTRVETPRGWGGRVRTRREEVLHEPHPLGGHADRLLTAMPRRVVHDGTPHVGHRRDGGQVHQSFPFKRALDAFGDTFLEPQGVDERFIGHSLARVAGTAGVEFGEKRHLRWLHRVECDHGGLLLAGLGPTGGRPAPAIIPSVLGGRARPIAVGRPVASLPQAGR
jgi:hypothetical protein